MRLARLEPSRLKTSVQQARSGRATGRQPATTSLLREPSLTDAAHVS
jgi:hypothetical protein